MCSGTWCEGMYMGQGVDRDKKPHEQVSCCSSLHSSVMLVMKNVDNERQMQPAVGRARPLGVTKCNSDRL